MQQVSRSPKSKAKLPKVQKPKVQVEAKLHRYPLENIKKMTKEGKKKLIASLDALHGDTKKIKKKKKKKLSGDARRRAKKRKLLESGGSSGSSSSSTATSTKTVTTITTTTQPVSTEPITKRPKKRNRKNAKCECTRCGRTLQKSNLKGHLEKCDGTRFKYDPDHVPSHIREKQTKANASTDDTLADMFSKYCEQNNLEGSDDDFAAWSQVMLENAQDTMKNVTEEKKKRPASSKVVRQKKEAAAPLPAVYTSSMMNTTRVSTGKKKSFSSDEEVEDDSEDEDELVF